MHVISRKALRKFWEKHSDSKSSLSRWFKAMNDDDYDMAIERLNHLIDDVGNNEQHPLYELLDTLGTMIHAYEEKHHQVPESSGVEMLQFFMNEQGLLTSDLQEIGSPNTISKILDGKRELTVKQIRALAERFHVSPAVFI